MMRLYFCLFLFVMTDHAYSEVGFSAPVYRSKKQAHITHQGQILFDKGRKKFFAIESHEPSIPSTSWTAFNSTVPMITCWQGFRPETEGTEGRWRRVGDTMEITVRYEANSSFSRANKVLNFKFPENYEADLQNGNFYLGEGVLSSRNQKIIIQYDSVTKKMAPVLQENDGRMTSLSGVELMASDYLNFKVKTKIKGWTESAPKIDDEC